MNKKIFGTLQLLIFVGIVFAGCTNDDDNAVTNDELNPEDFLLTIETEKREFSIDEEIILKISLSNMATEDKEISDLNLDNKTILIDIVNSNNATLKSLPRWSLSPEARAPFATTTTIKSKSKLSREYNLQDIRFNCQDNYDPELKDGNTKDFIEFIKIDMAGELSTNYIITVMYETYDPIEQMELTSEAIEITIHNRFENYLFVEKVSYHYTEFISGNYTGRNTYVDTPWYWIDVENESLSYGLELPNETKLIYGVGSHFGGLRLSGGSNVLRFIEELPASLTANVYWAGTNFNVTIHIDEENKVLINGSRQLFPGDYIRYTYDYENEFIDTSNNNETCIIRYYGYTQIKNFGFWSRSNYVWIEP